MFRNKLTALFLATCLLTFFMFACCPPVTEKASDKKGKDVEETKEVAEKPEKKEKVIKESEPKQKDEKESLEYKLASINAGGYISNDDVTIARFRYLLESLDEKTINSKQEIADMTVKGQEILRDDCGKEIKLLDLMEEANQSISSGTKADYAETMAVLLVLMGE